MSGLLHKQLGPHSLNVLNRRKSFKNCALGLPCQVENMSDNGSDYNFPDKIHISKMFSKRDRDLECEQFNFTWSVSILRTHCMLGLISNIKN